MGRALATQVRRRRRRPHRGEVARRRLGHEDEVQREQALGGLEGRRVAPRGARRDRWPERDVDGEDGRQRARRRVVRVLGRAAGGEERAEEREERARRHVAGDVDGGVQPGGRARPPAGREGGLERAGRPVVRDLDRGPGEGQARPEAGPERRGRAVAGGVGRAGRRRRLRVEVDLEVGRRRPRQQMGEQLGRRVGRRRPWRQALGGGLGQQRQDGEARPRHGGSPKALSARGVASGWVASAPSGVRYLPWLGRLSVQIAQQQGRPAAVVYWEPERLHQPPSHSEAVQRAPNGLPHACGAQGSTFDGHLRGHWPL
mmetsp:Transcript_125075/g.350258  ORF Transcript_125075/g.350258 Transcript_125075/m.350258 type:complete len:315 (+) Transcript_125075:1229-2173(+)